MNNKDLSLQLCFDALLSAAVASERCPQNGEDNIRADLVGTLARLGRIKVEISGRNWRTVVILEGEHAGKCTQRDPHGYPVWRVITKNGGFINGECWDKAARERSREQTIAARAKRLRAGELRRRA